MPWKQHGRHLAVNRAKMKLYDVKDSEQNIVDSGQDEFAQPVFDNTDFGQDWPGQDWKV